jgi:hypothetical protein
MAGRLVGVVGMAAFVVGGTPMMSAEQSDPAQLSGLWKLNAAASTNPDGPASAGRRAGSNSGGGSTDTTSLSPDEQRRFIAMRTMVFKAPPMMKLEATAAEFTMLLDPVTKFGFQHKTDNKKQAVVTPAGPAEFKVKWDGKKMRRELETKDSFKCVEEYSVSADGARLTVTVKAESGMLRNVQTVDIIRVYDRQSQAPLE